MALRKELHRRGFRYRLHRGTLPGRPDFILPKHNVAVFVNGCFWHRHEGCSKATTPKTNVTFWQSKFSANVSRDIRNYEALRHLGWNPIIVWECDIKRSVGDSAQLIIDQLDSDHSTHQSKD